MSINRISLGEIEIEKGNFAFLIDKGANHKIYEDCLAVEEKLKTNSEDCLNKLRILLETMGHELEIANRLNDNVNLSKEEVRRILNQEQLPHNDKFINAKGRDQWKSCKNKSLLAKVLVRLEEEKKLNTEQMLIDWIEQSGYTEGKYPGKFKYPDETYSQALVRKIYAASSGEHHSSDEKKECSTTMLISIIRVFFEILSAFFSNDEEYSIDKCPIGDYYPVRASDLGNLGFENTNIELYIREDRLNKKISYYILKKKKQDRREIEILDKLWNESMDSPDNIIRIHEKIGIREFERYVFSVPGRPRLLYSVKLNDDEKKKIIKGLIKTISSIHNLEPVVTLRNLCPLDIVVCENKMGIKPFIYNFESSKQWTEKQNYTVKSRLLKNSENVIRARYIAPEVLLEKVIDDYADKADIFSLGRIIEYLYEKDIDESLKELVAGMTSNEPEKRPSLEAVRKYFDGDTSQIINYAVLTEKKPGKKQQDSFVCGDCDEYQADFFVSSEKSKVPFVCGVFDGMGGGQDGEAVSKRAASVSKALLNKIVYENVQEQIKDIIHKTQENVRQYMYDEDIDYAGTTIVVCVLKENEVIVGNVGDSRAYLISDKGIMKLTKDHRFTSNVSKHAELYQYIGMEEDEVEIDPTIHCFAFSDGQYLMVSTDGLTDFVDDVSITEITTGLGSVEEKTKALVETARKNGSKDDITVILLRKGV